MKHAWPVRTHNQTSKHSQKNVTDAMHANLYNPAEIAFDLFSDFYFAEDIGLGGASPHPDSPLFGFQPCRNRI